MLASRKLCTGCTACKFVCDAEAISMVSDQDGFYYPVVELSLCQGCMRCEEACPVISPLKSEQQEPLAYLAFSKNENIRKNSSSGGMFSLLAEDVLGEGGSVFGCVMTDDFFGAHHVEVRNAQDLEKLRGSKYLQSDLEDVFQQVKKRLLQGEKVLFSGTPCQIAGLQKYLGDNPRENLLAVDVICHGVPSPFVWKCYLRSKEKKYGGTAVKVSFRNKEFGWKNFSLAIMFSNGERYNAQVAEDPYLRGFIQNHYLRESCFQCPFRGNHYHSDITLGDFWGIDQIYPDINDDAGISLVVAHTKKGVDSITCMDNRAFIAPAEFNDALRANPSYFSSPKKPPVRAFVLKDVRSSPDIEMILEKYGGTSVSSRIRRKTAKLFESFL
ncbi:MAG: Coenzyme F420 hydrogenase/dehydrogenase, beta subunit C-terminal domain [Ruminiclostridium sp.]|nr:Coenzyme F420 hydrogenase/dehydrogenase, beta subunit C-terminal domain [Ruminiclostridium sp.]